jgi:hypothetical protein
MNLDEAQRQRVTAWVLQGAKLSEIQNRLAEELGLKMTYMEVRFLVDDLKLTLKDPEPPKPAAPPVPPPAAPKAEAGAKPPGREASSPPAGGKVAVTVDQLTRPGAIVSGKVAFSDGQQAEWYLDQTGRLGVVTRQQGYKPSAADVQQFQAALQDELARMGFA